MIAIPERPPFAPEEYLEWEEKQPLKYEYIDGQVFAMTGGSIPHNDIAVNLTTALKNHLRGRGCKVSMADAKLGISEAGPFFYPDVMVTCDETDRRATKVLYHPRLIVEVISPKTEAVDRGQKFQNYRRISSLKEYVLIDTKRAIVECFRLNESGIWELYNYGEGDEIQLTSVDFSFPIDLLYEDVIFEETDTN
ncbi:MAG: Uma2 family endonuclease [Limnospira sp.]